MNHNRKMKKPYFQRPWFHWTGWGATILGALFIIFSKILHFEGKQLIINLNPQSIIIVLLQIGFWIFLYFFIRITLLNIIDQKYAKKISKIEQNKLEISAAKEKYETIKTEIGEGKARRKKEQIELVRDELKDKLEKLIYLIKLFYRFLKASKEKSLINDNISDYYTKGLPDIKNNIHTILKMTKGSNDFATIKENLLINTNSLIGIIIDFNKKVEDRIKEDIENRISFQSLQIEYPIKSRLESLKQSIKEIDTGNKKTIWDTLLELHSNDSNSILMS